MSEPVYRIKPLEWTIRPSGFWRTQDTAFGTLWVYFRNAKDNTWWFDVPLDNEHKLSWSFDTVDAAKAAAEAWYRKRISAGLEEVKP